MNRKGWDKLSPNYRRRLERRGVNRQAYERGDALTRARGHFTAPTTPGRRVTLSLEREESRVWKLYGRRARKLQAGDSIRDAFLVAKTIVGETALRETVVHYETMEALYEDGESDLAGYHQRWYDDMLDHFDFDYPEIELYYHGNTEG